MSAAVSADRFKEARYAIRTSALCVSATTPCAGAQAFGNATTVAPAGAFASTSNNQLNEDMIYAGTTARRVYKGMYCQHRTRLAHSILINTARALGTDQFRTLLLEIANHGRTSRHLVLLQRTHLLRVAVAVRWQRNETRRDAT